MKNLQNYINDNKSSLISLTEKLLVNKNLKRVSSDIEDFNDITEVFAIGYEEVKEYFFVNKYDIVTIARHDFLDGQIEYIMTAKSKLYAMTNMHARFNEDNKILRTFTSTSTNYIFIHPEDKKRLDKLYDFVKQLRPNEKYSLYNIINKKLGIDLNYIDIDPHIRLGCNMASGSISNVRMEIAKALQQL